MACLCCILVPGCLFGPDLEGVETIVARELKPARLETAVKLELGPGLLPLGRLACDWSDAEDELGRYTAEIRKVQVAVYRVQGIAPEQVVRVSETVRRRLEGKGWEVLVKAREAADICWVFYLPQGSAIRELYVFAVKDGKLALVRVHGRLDRMIAKALADHPEALAGLAEGQ